MNQTTIFFNKSEDAEKVINDLKQMADRIRQNKIEEEKEKEEEVTVYYSLNGRTVKGIVKIKNIQPFPSMTDFDVLVESPNGSDIINFEKFLDINGGADVCRDLINTCRPLIVRRKKTVEYEVIPNSIWYITRLEKFN